MNAAHKALKKKMEDEYEMPKKEAISEHKRLLKVLKTGKGEKKEFKTQKSELKKIISSKED